MCIEDNDIVSAAQMATLTADALALANGIEQIYTHEELNLDSAGVRVVMDNGAVFDLQVIAR